MTGFASVKLARHLTSRQGDLSIRNKNKLLKMFEKQLTYDALDIADKEIFIQMGYGENTPGEDILAEMNEMKATVRNILQPKFCFTVIEGGELNTEEKLLSVEGTTFSVGRIISSQLRGSVAYAFFVATSGTAFEALQRRLEAEGDMLRVFIADSMGSEIGRAHV